MGSALARLTKDRRIGEEEDADDGVSDAKGGGGEGGEGGKGDIATFVC